MTTAEVFQRPETIEDLKKIQLSQTSVNYSAELGFEISLGFVSHHGNLEIKPH